MSYCTIQQALQDLESELDRDCVEELVRDFIQECPASLEELKTLVALGPSDDLTRAAHSLKGSSSIYRAEDLMALCQELEKASAEGFSDKLSEIFSRIEMAVPPVLRAIESYLNPDFP